jgi:hypothetical protein
MPELTLTTSSERKTAPQPGCSPYRVSQTNSWRSDNQILRLQRLVGNHTVNQIIQTKLTVSAPGDRFEQEADLVADQVMGATPPTRASTQSAGSAVQRKCDSCASGSGKCEGCAKEEIVQLKPISTGATHSSAGNALHRHEVAGAMPPLHAGGSPLSGQERAFFEPRLGHDLSHVRIHDDATAAESARALHAHAYSTRNHIVFASGRYSPQSTEGRRLLAHELVHVVQQSGGAAVGGMIQRKPDDAPVHETKTSEVANLSQLSGVPYEKWSETIEQQYRLRGDLVRANAVRACRTQGRAACARLLTATESMRLHALAKSSGGDEEKIKAGLASAAPLLTFVQQAQRAAPLLRLVPPPVAAPPVVGPGIGGAAAAGGIAAVVAVCVIAAYQLWELGKFQEELRAKGFIILEDPLAQCIGACHAPSRSAPPLARDFPPLTGSQIEDWLRPEAGRKPQQPSPVPAQKTDPEPDTEPEQPKSKKCTEKRVKELHDEVEKQCKKRNRRCTMQNTCEEATEGVSAGYACIAARQKMQKECWEKGDAGYEGHMQQIADAYAALRRCEAVMKDKCK